MMAIPHTVIERESANLLPWMPEIIALANGEKEALGFLSHSAYEDAIKRKRLMAMLVSGDAGHANSISVATGLIGKVELPHFTRPPRS